MSQKWIRKDDRVVVIAGNSKGIVGKVLSKQGEKIIVQGAHICKKHMKARAQGEQSQIIEIERPIHISNVRLCDAEGKPLKLRVKLEGKEKSLVHSQGAEKEKTHRVIKKPKQ